MKLMSRYAIVLALVSVFSLASAAEAVDFIAATSLGIHVSRHQILKGQKVKIHGRLKSDHHSCVNDEKIKLFAKRKGLAWRQVARTRTIWNGGYKFTRTPGKTTRFKTRYPGKVTGCTRKRTCACRACPWSRRCLSLGRCKLRVLGDSRLR